jgi:hypothetical protein
MDAGGPWTWGDGLAISQFQSFPYFARKLGVAIVQYSNKTKSKWMNQSF